MSAGRRVSAELRKVRVAVVGTGEFGRNHARVYRELENVEFAGVLDEDASRAGEIAKEFQTRTFQGIEELRGAIDAASVAVPTVAHREIGCALLEMGIDVLVEKPMALTLEEADRMIGVARETGRSLCVDHNRLFSPPALEARRLLEAGELGELVSVDFFQGFGLPTRMRLSQFDNQWLSKLPGGLVQDLVPHCLYCLLEFVGHPVRLHVLTKRTGVLPAAPAEEVRLMMEGERVLGTASISLSAQPFMNHLTLYGSKATARINIDNFTLIVRKNRYSHPLFNRVFGNMEEGWKIFSSSARSTFRFATGKPRSR